jgi:hypothetical protein
MTNKQLLNLARNLAVVETMTSKQLLNLTRNLAAELEAMRLRGEIGDDFDIGTIGMPEEFTVGKQAAFRLALSRVLGLSGFELVSNDPAVIKRADSMARFLRSIFPSTGGTAH